MNEITLDQLQGALRSAAKEIDPRIAAVLKATAEKVKDTQRSLVAVGPDNSTTHRKYQYKHTRDLIRVTGMGGQRMTPKTLAVEVGPKDALGKPWYIGRFLEFGTAHSAPKPFIDRSYEPHRASHEIAIAEAMTSGALALIAGT